MAKLIVGPERPLECITVEAKEPEEVEMMLRAIAAADFDDGCLYLVGYNENRSRPCLHVGFRQRNDPDRMPSRQFLLDHLNAIIGHAQKLQRDVDPQDVDGLVKHPSTAILAHAEKVHKKLCGYRATVENGLVTEAAVPLAGLGRKKRK
jgi:hypothetical protein